MPNRRHFIGRLAGAGMFIGSHGFADAAFAIQTPPARRRASIGGRRVTVVDVHAHCFVPEVWEVVQNTPLAAAAKNNLTGAIALGPGTAERLQYMDKEGVIASDNSHKFICKLYRSAW